MLDLKSLFRLRRVCKALRSQVDAYLPSATKFRLAQLLTPSSRLAPSMIKEGPSYWATDEGYDLLLRKSDRLPCAVLIRPQKFNPGQKTRMLREAVDKGRWEVASWLVTTYKLTATDIQRGELLSAAIQSGSVKTVEWLMATFLSKADPREVVKGWIYPTKKLQELCHKGNLEMVIWFVAAFQLTATEVRADDNFAFRQACNSGNCQLVAWLATSFNLTATDARANVNAALRSACANGRLDLAQWLADTFQLTAEDARAVENEPLRDACRVFAHIDIAKWLVATFGLTITDARSRDNAILRNALTNGCVELVRWLMSTFRYTAADVYDYCQTALVDACQQGHRGVLELVMKKFTPKPEALTAVLNRACELGRSEIAEWLAASFKCPLASGKAAARTACEHGHLRLTANLLNTFELSTAVLKSKSVRKQIQLALVHACESGMLDEVQWLTAQFEITAQEAIFADPEIKQPRHLSSHKKRRSQQGYDTVDARPTSANAMLEACINKRFDVAFWLMDALKVPGTQVFHQVTHIANAVRNALAEACQSGDVDQVQSLIIVFEFSPEDLRAIKIVQSSNSILAETCAHGHFEVAQWLASKYSFTAAEAAVAMKAACRHGHLELAEWLMTMYQVNPIDVLGVNTARSTSQNKLLDAYNNALLDEREWLLASFKLYSPEARAVLFKAQGEYDKAIHLYGLALAAKLKAIGNDTHPRVADTYDSMAGAYSAKRDFFKALELHNRALAIKIKFNGDNCTHISTAMSLAGAGDMETKLGKVQEGKVKIQGALDMLKFAPHFDVEKHPRAKHFVSLLAKLPLG